MVSNGVHTGRFGDGSHEKTLRAEARRLALGDVVTFAGRVPHDEVERHLSLLDIAPLPGLPLQVCELISPINPFEAMAMEKVVLAYDIAALIEIVQDDVTGRTFRKGGRPRDLARVLSPTCLRSPSLTPVPW